MRRLFTAALLLFASTSAMGEAIQLINGDVINAPVTAQDAEGVTIQHPSLGEIKVSRAQIKQIYKDADAMAEAEAKAEAEKKAADLAAERAADDGLFGTGVLEGWNRRLEAGLTGASGVSENLNLRIGFFADYEDEEDRWLLDLLYRRAKSEGAITQNNFKAALTKDWLVPGEDYFYFATGRYDWDDLQDWEHRLSGFGGLGYQFIKDEKWDVRGRGGLGATREFNSANDDIVPEALLGVEAAYQIADRHSVAFSNTLYPSLKDGGEFRNITTLDYVIGVDVDMDLRLGIANEHDSDVTRGTRKNDFTYYVTLNWKF